MVLLDKEGCCTSLEELSEMANRDVGRVFWLMFNRGLFALVERGFCGCELETEP